MQIGTQVVCDLLFGSHLPAPSRATATGKIYKSSLSILDQAHVIMALLIKHLARYNQLHIATTSPDAKQDSELYTADIARI